MTVLKQYINCVEKKSLGSFKNVIYICLQIIYIFDIYV